MLPGHKEDVYGGVFALTKQLLGVLCVVEWVVQTEGFHDLLAFIRLDAPVLLELRQTYTTPVILRGETGETRL